MNTVEIFQNLAYPIAVSAILFLSLVSFAKNFLKEMRERDKNNEQMRSEYINYLQKCNSELTCSIKENTEALNRFSKILEIINFKLTEDGTN